MYCCVTFKKEIKSAYKRARGHFMSTLESQQPTMQFLIALSCLLASASTSAIPTCDECVASMGQLLSDKKFGSPLLTTSSPYPSFFVLKDANM